MMKLICIPAYNEEKNITTIVKDCKKFADGVIVCDDGSTDDTAKLAEAEGAVVLQHKKNQGYGSAISTLFDYCRKENADIMLTIDGDGQHSTDQIPLLFNAITKHKVDVAIGSRFLNDDDTPAYRKAGIKIITSATNYATHLKVSNKGLSLAEVPINISYEGDTSKQNPISHGTSVFATTMKYVSIRHPLLFYGLPGIVLFISGLVIAATFIDAYLFEQSIYYGSLLGSVVLILLGSILMVTSILLYSMANLFRDRN